LLRDASSGSLHPSHILVHRFWDARPGKAAAAYGPQKEGNMPLVVKRPYRPLQVNQPSQAPVHPQTEATINNDAEKAASKEALPDSSEA
jgi:hypothetical protein